MATRALTLSFVWFAMVFGVRDEEDHANESDPVDEFADDELAEHDDVAVEGNETRGEDQEDEVPSMDNFAERWQLDEMATDALKTFPRRLQRTVMKEFHADGREHNISSKFMYFIKMIRNRDQNLIQECRYFAAGHCKNADACMFTHSKATERRASSSEVTKTCKYFLAGNCRHGDSCSHSHRKAETPVSSKIAKACKYFASGHCKTGTSCAFSHVTASRDSRDSRESRESRGKDIPLEPTGWKKSGTWSSWSEEAPVKASPAPVPISPGPWRRSSDSPDGKDEVHYDRIKEFVKSWEIERSLIVEMMRYNFDQRERIITTFKPSGSDSKGFDPNPAFRSFVKRITAKGNSLLDGFAKKYDLDEQAIKAMEQLDPDMQQEIVDNFRPGANTRDMTSLLTVFIRSRTEHNRSAKKPRW